VARALAEKVGQSPRLKFKILKYLYAKMAKGDPLHVKMNQ